MLDYIKCCDKGIERSVRLRIWGKIVIHVMNLDSSTIKLVMVEVMLSPVAGDVLIRAKGYAHVQQFVPSRPVDVHVAAAHRVLRYAELLGHS